MSWNNRVVWSEGTFLQPQHFQQHDRYLEAYVEGRARALQAHGWGFTELALDEAALELGKVSLRVARGILPDGTPFDFPASDPSPEPLNIPPNTRDAIVLLALPVRHDRQIRRGQRQRHRHHRLYLLFGGSGAGQRYGGIFLPHLAAGSQWGVDAHQWTD